MVNSQLSYSASDPAPSSQAQFTARAFCLPEKLVDDIHAQPHKSLTDHLKAHADDLGDYGLAKSWYQTLAKTCNWAGNTMGFQFIWAHFDKERDGNTHYRQMMIEDSEGQPVGYVRFTHLQTERKGMTRRKDCTKVEETIVCDPKYLKDTSLFRFIYDVVEQDAIDHGKKRIITELATGFSGPKFGGLAQRIKRLSGQLNSPINASDDGSDDDSVCESGPRDELLSEYKRAKRLLLTNWVDVTCNFAKNIGFTPTDIIVPIDRRSSATCQLRISRTVEGTKPLKLPPYKAKGKICTAIKSKNDIDALTQAVDTLRRQACERHGLDLDTLKAD